MRDSDADQFIAMLRDVFGLFPNAKPLTEGQVAMFFRALSRHSLADVRAALDAHVRDPDRGRFPPVPADVVAQLQGMARGDGRPGSEEAWAIALQAKDEAVTVVWTVEMAHAWAVCRPVLDLGDEVGARMAFREAYTRLVADARAAGVPASWAPTLGFDPEQRRVAIEAAAQLGRLPAPDAAALLPAPWEEAGPPSERMRQVLRTLRDSIVAEIDGPSAAELERQDTERRKAEARAKVAAYQPGVH